MSVVLPADVVEVLKKQYRAAALYKQAATSAFNQHNQTSKDLPVVGATYKFRGNPFIYVVKSVDELDDLVELYNEANPNHPFIHSGASFRANFERYLKPTIHGVTSVGDGVEPDKPLHMQYFNTQPHECPCGISRKDCTYHG